MGTPQRPSHVERPDPVGIGLVGCGTMGAELAHAVSSKSVGGSVGNAVVLALFDEDETRAAELAGTIDPAPAVSATVDALVATPGLTLVAECASPAAVREHGERILAACSLLTLSSGALADDALLARLSRLASDGGRELIVPSGALGGIDAIRTVRSMLDEVTLTSTKPPAAFKGAPGFAAWEDAEIVSATVLYEGPAAAAVELFPANVNVAATLSLAGIGPHRTIVRVVADPAAPGNVHEVRAVGGFGELTFRMVNEPHVRNPKTSHLAVLSAIEALRTYCETGPRIGT